MPSTFLNQVFQSEIPKEFRDDLNVIASLSCQDIATIVDVVGQWVVADIIDRDFERAQILEQKVIDTVQLPPEQRGSVVRLTRFFLQVIVQRDIKETTLIVEELISHGFLEESSRKGLMKFLETIGHIAAGPINDAIFKQAYSDAGIPRLTAIGAYVDFRSVFTRSFNPGEPIETYEPRFKSFLPLLIVNLRLQEEDEHRKIVFQMDRRTAELLIDSLNAAVKDLDETLRSAMPVSQM